MFVNILDTTIVNVALPTLADEFDVRTASIEWVVTGYLLSLAVWIPASGWIGDRVGTKRTFLFAIVVFTAASALCGAATSLDQLIAFRILQGVGGGMLTPTGFAMLMRAFPPERRAAISRVIIIPTVIAPASGPVIGGFLIDSLSWRWVFYLNLPIGVATLVFGWIFLREHREPRAGGFDVPGFLLSAASLALVLFALSEGPQSGWSSPTAWGPGLLGLAALGLLVKVELEREAPLLQMRLVSDRMFRGAMAVSTFATGAFLGVLFVMPIFLQEVRGASAFESGLTTFPEAVGVLIGAQIAGRLYPTVGPRRLMTPGLAAMAVVLVLLTTLDAETNLWLVRLLMLAVGFSMAFAMMPLQACAFTGIRPADTGRASSIYNAQRQVASALGVAVLATILAASLPDRVPSVAEQVDAFRAVFLAAALIAVIGVVAALRIRDADAAATMRVRSG
ncbi:MAG: multidrug efflux MFS transporter [Dehalococcoidia bacterium]|nr:multidrug efflux MFS transporter [Dehalococcoidia bacterium]